MAENASSSLMITLPARGLDADSDGEQRRAGEAVLAGERRRHAVAVCAVVLERVRPVMRAAWSGTCAVAAGAGAGRGRMAGAAVHRIYVWRSDDVRRSRESDRDAERGHRRLGRLARRDFRIGSGLRPRAGVLSNRRRAGDSGGCAAWLLTSAVTTLTGNVVIALPRADGGLRVAAVFFGRRGVDARRYGRQVQIIEVQPHAADVESWRRRHGISDATGSG